MGTPDRRLTPNRAEALAMAARGMVWRYGHDTPSPWVHLGGSGFERVPDGRALNWLMDEGFICLSVKISGVHRVELTDKGRKAL